MHKRKALTLREGDLISWGNSMWTAKLDREGGWHEGTVMFVTEKGGVRVRDKGGALYWVPYHFVGSLLARASA